MPDTWVLQAPTARWRLVPITRDASGQGGDAAMLSGIRHARATISLAVIACAACDRATLGSAATVLSEREHIDFNYLVLQPDANGLYALRMNYATGCTDYLFMLTSSPTCCVRGSSSSRARLAAERRSDGTVSSAYWPTTSISWVSGERNASLAGPIRRGPDSPWSGTETWCCALISRQRSARTSSSPMSYKQLNERLSQLNAH